MSEAIDYEAVLANLEAKKAVLEATITGIRQILNLGVQVAPMAANGGRLGPPAIVESDAFFGLSIGDAAKKYLAMMKRKQSAATIAEALDKGGLQHTSKFFPNTVRTSLIRLAAEGEVVQVGKEWGLAEWYPGRRRVKKDGQTVVEASESDAPDE